MNFLGDAAVGSLVYLRVDGTYVPFRVMHHGKPSDLYDDSFAGGTILCKDYTGAPYSTQMVANISDAKGTYAQSFLHQDLNQNWLAKLDPAMQQAIVEVKLPYRTDTDDEPYVVASGSEGLAAKIWLPSLSEITDLVWYDPANGDPYVEEGAMFDYWKAANGDTFESWRRSDIYGTDIGWGTRTPNHHYAQSSLAPYFFRIGGEMYAFTTAQNAVEVWPCLVLPDTMVIDSDQHLHLVGSMPVKVGGVWKEGSAWCCVGGVWSEAAAIGAKTGGSWKE